MFIKIPQRNPLYTEIDQRRAVCREEKRRHAVCREERREKKEYHCCLLCTMRFIAWDLQVNPVYPSDTDDLDWQDPTPDSDKESPYSLSNYYDKIE